MEPVIITNKLSHKEWRRRAKKERRRKIRQREARARDADAERLEAKLKKSADYLNWLEAQRVEEELRIEKENKEHELREQQWLEEEVRAQKEWQIQKDRKAKARKEQFEQEELIRKEFEEKQEALRLKREELRRREEEETKRYEEEKREIEAYIDEGSSTPEILRGVKNTQPGKELCPFFSKTGACRYGDTCSRNHQRFSLSKVILIPGFYFHFSLEKNTAEYDTDVALEFDGSEMRRHFREFYNDVVPELETFGRIKTLKFCRNTEIHLRGNMYVEYYSEREAAKALRSLKGRWYAGRQLNCEFVNLKSWRNAICGMPKCPKGRACNFLHTFRNPRDEYDVKSPPRSRTRQGTGSSRSSRLDQESTRSSGWQNQQREESSRNWRWSESPEPMPESRRRRDDNSRDDFNKNKKRKRRREEKKEKEKEEEAEGESKEKRRERNGRRRSSRTSREKRKEKKTKDRSKKRDLANTPENTKWDNQTNVATDSDGDSTPLITSNNKRSRKTKKRSRSRSFSEDEASETSNSSTTEDEARKSKTPHR